MQDFLFFRIRQVEVRVELVEIWILPGPLVHKPDMPSAQAALVASLIVLAILVPVLKSVLGEVIAAMVPVMMAPPI